MKVSIQVDTALVRQGLENLTAAVPQIGRRRMRSMMERVKRRMEAYPPEPPHRVRYAIHPRLGRIIVKTGRTGKLGQSWKIKEIKDDKRAPGYELSNTAAHKGREYARYVVGRGDGTGQAWMHKGRWQVMRKVIDSEVNKLPQEVTAEIMIAGRKEGFKTS